jgi:mannosylglycoprotein endo-beta-mannosidase
MSAISAVWSRKLVNLGILNSAYITLIPKKEDADQPKDFRPISLVHSFAKLITKLLANRLAPKLQEMVPPVRSAFIKGRFIQDNFMLVQQTARYLHQQKEPRILLKLDIYKASDSVSWPFLLEILQQLGFGQIWRDIISGLLFTSTTQILLNGVPGDLISHRRVLLQGDPLSPMMFILVMDVLGHMISKAANEGLLLPLSRRAFKHCISMHADDVVLFLRPAAEDIEITMDILSLFGEATGFKTNLQKSNVLPIRCENTDISNVQALLPCPLAEFPCKYLGLPLSLKKLTRNQVQPYVDSIADQLQGCWKANLMTKAGRRVQVQLCSLESSSTSLWRLSFQLGLSKQLIKFGEGSCGEVAGMHLGATAQLLGSKFDGPKS